ncbi:MAG: response regulator [Verrucomicrobiota bacterium]
MSETKNNSSRRILIIDDNQAIHQDFRKIFGPGLSSSSKLRLLESTLFRPPFEPPERPVFEIDSAFQGKEGLAMVCRALEEGRPYMMAFVDVRMPPGWDGIETTGKIWQHDPDLQVVICTAYSDYSLEKMLEQLGNSDRLVILKKPFDNIEVQQLANALTEKWKLLQQSKCKMDELESLVADRTRELKATTEKLYESQKMEAIGQLAGGVAHDFNNLLTVICCHTQLMLDAKDLTPKLLRSVKQIATAAERAAELTRQLLAYARKGILQRRDLNLNEVINRLIKMLERVLGEEITLQIQCDQPSLSINADEAMLEQIILNFALNARDAMAHGGQLTIRAAAVEVNQDHVRRNADARTGQFVCLSMTDTGCGIAPEILLRIFEPFFTTKDVGKGTGLGLATVYGMVQLHQGWIEVESAVGKGTAFKVFLPGSDSVKKNLPEASSPRTAQVCHETILFVEDEPALRELGRLVLEQYGYRVLEAGAGAEALEVWKQQASTVDLLLTDMVMPGGLNGQELAAQLQADKPGLKIIYTSGHSANLLGKHTGLQAGLNFLPKPYNPQSLGATVRRCLDSGTLPGVNALSSTRHSE